jgi:cytochrome c6
MITNHKIFFLLFFLIFNPNIEEGKKIFFSNCNVCHINGKNIIIPEKNLYEETLKNNGLNNIKAISYEILNGKNGMPAFGGRLTEKEINNVANYVLIEALSNFKNN